MKNVSTATAVAPTQNTAVATRKFSNEAMIGSGYQNDGSPFINLAFDRDITEEGAVALVRDLYRNNKRFSLQPVKNISAKAPARKYVLVVRAPMQG